MIGALTESGLVAAIATLDKKIKKQKKEIAKIDAQHEELAAEKKATGPTDDSPLLQHAI